MDQSFLTPLLHTYPQIMVLNLYIDKDIEDYTSIVDTYTSHIQKHNFNICNNQFYDSGFDLFFTEDTIIECSSTKLYNTHIRCSAYILQDTRKQYYTGYYLYPRSSIYKTPIRFANSVGIIDSGYRNNICLALDTTEDYYIKKLTRISQICAPGLIPIYVNLVDSQDLLQMNTERSMGGFGSTGEGV